MIDSEIEFKGTLFKGTLCRFENLPISLFSYEKNMLKISRLNIFYFLRCTRVRYVKSLYTNIQKK